MATFQTEYEDTTTTIDNVVNTQLSSVLSWANVPGSLVKAVSSSAGYAWGYNGSNQVFICQLPCSGNWTPIDMSKYSLSAIHDIVADMNNVYILASTTGSTILLIASASNQGDWSSITVPFSATTVFSTHSFIWVQDGSNAKQRCPKPCTMSNWIPSKDVSVQITSSSDTALYGKDASGTPMKSDETLQTGWQPISALSGTKVESVFGQMDQSALYGIDTSLKLFRFDGKDTTPVDTAGYTPLNLSLDPGSKQMWMTSVTPGDKGNVFSRVDTPDYSAIMNTLNPLDRKRDDVVKDVETSYKTQTDVMTVNKQVSDVVSYFKNIFHLDKTTGKKGMDQAGHLQEKIRTTQQELDQINAVQPIIQKLLVLLIVVAAIYLFGTFIGGMVHVLAGVILVGGVYYIMNNPTS